MQFLTDGPGSEHAAAMCNFEAFNSGITCTCNQCTDLYDSDAGTMQHHSQQQPNSPESLTRFRVLQKLQGWTHSTEKWFWTCNIALLFLSVMLLWVFCFLDPSGGNHRFVPLPSSKVGRSI